MGIRTTGHLEAVLKTRTAFEKLSNQPPDASQNAPYHRYIHPICLIFYFCFRAYNNFKTASEEPEQWRKEIVEIVNTANEKLAEIGDEEMAIGPSHFMQKDLDESKLKLIWKHSVLPHIKECLAGEKDSLEGFGLEELRKSITSDSQDSEDASN